MDNLNGSPLPREIDCELPDSVRYSFHQLFDIEEVQKIQDSFSKATGVASIITDIDGTPITKPSSFSVFCNEVIRKTEKGLCNCMQSDAIIGSPNPDGPRFQRCLSGGLLDGGTSIMIGSHHVANWLIGQVLDEDTDINCMYKYCDEIGADFHTYEDALKNINKMPKEQFECICNFLYLNAKMLSTQAIKNILQQEEINKRNQTEEKYRQLFDNAAEAIAVEQRGLIRMCNPMANELTGYSSDEILSLPVNQFVHPDDRKLTDSMRLNYADSVKENSHYQFRVLKKDNTFRWVEMNTIKISWEGQPAALHFIADITARKITEDALRLSEEKYRLLTEFTSDVIWVFNLSVKKYTYVSPSIYQLRGITIKEALDESIEETLVPDSLRNIKSYIARGVRDLKKNPATANSYVIEVQQPCKNGDIIWVEFSIRFRRNAEGEIEVVGSSRNIEKRKKAEEEVLFLSYKDQLTGLYNRRFYEEELKRVDIPENLPLTLVMVDVNGLKLTNDAFGHSMGDLLLIKAASAISAVCTKEATAARIGGDEFVLILPRCSEDKAENIISRINQMISNEKIDNIILSVSVGFAVKNFISEDINEVFGHAEDNMYKNKLYESSSMRSRTIDIIMNTLFEKNNREMLHSQRVSAICEAIASKMNFDKDDTNQLRLAGLMHDIGKIGIDEQILNKPMKLNGSERNEIHRHSEIGYRILSSVNEFSEIAEYVLAHHERWDGGGYPKGLKGDQIPLKARIISIADAYDAMTSTRTYREALSMKEAAKEIIRCSNTQFDADIAKIFVEKVLGIAWS